MSAAQALVVLERLRALGVQADDITADSRKVGPGCVFAAWPGQRTDGRRFLVDAAAHGERAAFEAALTGLIRTDRTHRLWEGALALAAADLRAV